MRSLNLASGAPGVRYAFRFFVCILLAVNVFARPAQRAPELIYHNFI